MKIRHAGLLWNLIVVGAMFVVGPSAILASPSLISEVKTPPSEPMPRDGVPVARLSEAYGKLPLVFESNQGQTAPEVTFLSRGPGYGLFLTPTEAVLTLSRAADAKADHVEVTMVGMKLVGAKAKPEMAGVDPLPGKSHYFIGNDPKQWHTNVPQYTKVRYKAVYPGIDLVYYGNQYQLEYDLVVAPGADPRKIKLAFQGVQSIQIDANGQLVLRAGAGDLVQRKPIVYQEINGERKNLEGRYVLQGKRQVGFQVVRYDTSRPLIIDPVLAYSTYLGGAGCPPGVCSNDDAGFGIAVDSDGNTYLTGRTLGFPTTAGAYDQVCGSPSGSFGEGGCVHIMPSSDCAPCTTVYNPDAFVAKLNASGTALIYSTYLGGGLPYLGGNPESGTSIAVDSTGNAYVTGQTRSADFPVTPGALRTTCGCGTYISDAFVTKLNPSGSALVYSTYLAGSSNDIGYGIALDGAGNAYVTGVTSSSDFPAANAAQAAYGGGNDAFVAKLNATGTALLYSTFLGGSGDDAGRGIAVRSDGSASLTGTTTSANFPLASAYQSVFGGGADAFVTTLSAAGSLSSSTYLGGSGNDYGYGIALDSAGDAYVAGSTASTNFPTTTGAFTGAFAAKLGASGTSLLYSTNPGGGAGYGIAVNGVGNAFVTGVNGNDAFVSQLTANGSGQVYTVALGGSGIDSGNAIAVDGAGNAYVTGSTTSTDLPTTPGAVQPAYGGGSSDVFVSKIAEASAVRFSAATYSAAEGTGGVTITVERIGSTAGAISVNCSTSDGTALAGADYIATTGTIYFANGDSTPKTCTIPIIDDTAVEPSETLNITLSNPVGNVYLNSPASAVLTIVDNDTSLAFSSATYSVAENAGTATITVTRTGSSAAAVSVDYATSNGSAQAGSDYTATTGTISFAAGDTAPKTFSVSIVDDMKIEPNETVVLTLSNPTGGATIGNPGTATLTIVDNEPAQLINISTRSVVQTGNNVMIGGFTIGGGGSKTVLIRARGPSLSGAPFNLTGTLANPYVKLYSGSTVIAQNDNWQTTDPLCGSPAISCGNATQISATGTDPCQPNPGQTSAPPGCAYESAILITLPPGAYTAIVSGVSGGTGLGMVEVNDFDMATAPKLTNISTRGVVQTGNNVMIGGFIIGGGGSKTVLIRARGPSLSGAPFNLTGTLANPYVKLYSGSTVIAQNDNWQTTDPLCGSPAISCGNATQISATGTDPCQPNPGQTSAPPGCAYESAILITLPPGAYTAIVSGVSGGTGLGMVEVNELN